MGGKKKTKWRKLPLEEFTKEISTKPEKVPSNDKCQTDFTSEENSYYIPSNNEPIENAQNYTEPYENIDGLWYPTSCVVYNPAEVGLYPSYMMPLDNYYYYYTMPEVPQMQEYVSMPYQDYTSALPKDTVYLLLPTQTPRPSEPVQNLAPEWQNRRRRHRYECYADYAVIPDKPNSTKADEKDYYKFTSRHINSRKNSAQSSNFRKMTSFSETSNFGNSNSVSEQNPMYRKSSEVRKNLKSSTDMKYESDPISVNKEIDLNKENVDYQKSKKKLEMCSIHLKNATDIKEPQSIAEKVTSSSLRIENETNLEDELLLVDNENKELYSGELSNDNRTSSHSNNLDSDSSNIFNMLENKKTEKNISEEQFHKKNNIFSSANESSEHDLSLHDLHQEINTKTKTPSLKSSKVDALHRVQNSLNNENSMSLTLDDTSESNSQSSLPDILSTLNTSQSREKKKEPEDSKANPLPDSADLNKGITTKSKSLLSLTSNLPNLLSSEALHSEMEMELRQLQNLHSLKANQSIYKLAYDENITDQSEADSRSPSPVDPESQVPSSLTSNEIIVHEADSGSEAGSEDVELLPHRYESESFLNENKHVYINKLSLAVELLRTQENLPYDDEFKRVVGENNHSNNIVPGVHTGGKVNMGFMEDSIPSKKFSVTRHFENKSASTSTNANDVSMHQAKRSANNNNDSGIVLEKFSDIETDSFEELCEPASEAVAQSSDTLDNTGAIREGYRRFGVQARYFSPRAALSLNPCFCCVIM